MVDSAAVFLYTLFAADQRWSREHAQKIRKTLGPFPASAANRVCESVKRIVKHFPEKIDKGSKNSATKEGYNVEDNETKKEFGSNIVFASPRNVREEVLAFSSSEENGGKEIEQDSLSEDEAAETNDAFSQALLLGMAQKSKTNGSSGGERVKSKSSGRVGVVAMETGDPAPFSSEWLAGKLQEVCCGGGEGGGGMGWSDLYGAVFDVLSSAQDNSVIQGEVGMDIGVNIALTVYFAHITVYFVHITVYFVHIESRFSLTLVCDIYPLCLFLHFGSPLI